MDFLSSTYTTQFVEEIELINGALKLAEDDILLPEPKREKRGWKETTLEEYLARMATCQTYIGRTLSPSTGMLRPIQANCHCWRKREGHFCVYCFANRVELIKEKVKNVYSGSAPLSDPVGFAEMDNGEADRLTSGLPKAEYWRAPVGEEEDNRSVLFISMKKLKGVEGARKLTRGVLGDIDYEHLAATPGKKRTSGTLNQPSVGHNGKVKEVVGFVNPDIVTAEMEKKAFEKALFATITYNPRTPKEYESNFKSRMEIYIAELRRINPKAVTGVSIRYRTVDLTCIDWSVHTKVKSEARAQVSAVISTFPTYGVEKVVH